MVSSICTVKQWAREELTETEKWRKVPNSAYVVKFKSTFRTDLETRMENANIAFKKIVTTLDLRFKDLKCIPRAERGEVWASVTNLIKKQRVVAKKPVKATSVQPKKKLALLAASPESDSEQKDDSIK